MKKNVIISLIIVSFASTSFSQSAEEAIDLLQRTYGFGARSMSMGTAYTGVADDYSSMWAFRHRYKQTQNGNLSDDKVLSLFADFENNSPPATRSSRPARKNSTGKAPGRTGYEYKAGKASCCSQTAGGHNSF